MIHRRPLQLLNVLAVVGLGVVLVAMYAWGVIGKHRFDPEARSFYKASRAVHSTSQPQPAAFAAIVVVVIPPDDLSWENIPLLSQTVPGREPSRYAPSRSPPFA